MSNLYIHTEASEALPALAGILLKEGSEIGSRQGERVLEKIHQQVTLTAPWRREVLTTGRKASLPAQVAETMWVLGGRADVEWLSHYLPRAADFSDDGVVWRGGYGPRLRSWFAWDEGLQEMVDVDQLAHVVNLLKSDRSSRRAVIAIYDPATDAANGKDIPCNNWLQFLNRDGKLHLHVTTRSNDLIWGWSGINQFEWSALQEIVAGMLGTLVGDLHFSIGSLHVYDRHWKKAKELDLMTGTRYTLADSPRFKLNGIHMDTDPIKALDGLISKWFTYEEKLRTRTWSTRYAEDMINGFPEPMLQSWLRVIANHWYGTAEGFLRPLEGTRLALAAALSPKSPVEAPVKAEIPRESGGVLAEGDAFTEFVVDLHAQKDKVYGDSWKRRGEKVAIQANIARKVDRLAVAGAGDTAADTVIDLLVYLVKYRLWLTDVFGVVSSMEITPLKGFAGVYSDNPTYVAQYLRAMPRRSITTDKLEKEVQSIQETFEDLLRTSEPRPKEALVDFLIKRSAPVARLLWEKEVHLAAAKTAPQVLRTIPATEATTIITNANRPWAGYDDEEGSK